MRLCNGRLTVSQWYGDRYDDDDPGEREYGERFDTDPANNPREYDEEDDE
jgi:hypothetical protein